MLNWFQAEKRPLPFRETDDPYKIWVSEILAQQTRIAAMLPFYERFIKRFPTACDLADAPLDEVLTLWAGMGYYARARNLHTAACVIRDNYGGELPRTVEDLRSLPGIGAYTAGAIASIAYGLSEPAVDGNVRRVYSRLLASDDVSGADRWVHTLMTEAQESGFSPGEVTEALMELGALICLPKRPRCDRCPLKVKCIAEQIGEISKYPIRAKKKDKLTENRDIIVAKDGYKRYLMRKRTESILYGMLEFPEANTLLRDGFNFKITGCLIDAEHIFSHRIWKMCAHFAHVTLNGPLPDGYVWVPLEDMNHRAIPSAMRPFVRALETAAKEGVP